MTPHRMAERGIEVHVLPATATADDVLRGRSPTGCSSPTARATRPPPTTPVDVMRGVLDRRTPLFGICFGNQILGRALGFGTYKLKYGHRGINQPVQDRTTGKVEVTAHNHGFAVDAPLDQVSDTDVRPRRGQPRLPQRRRRRGPAAASTSRPSASSTTPKRPPARTTPPTCSTASYP